MRGLGGHSSPRGVFGTAQEAREHNLRGCSVKKRLVYFGHWTNPTGEEMLAEDENTELVCLDRAASIEEKLAALKTAHGHLLSMREIEITADLLAECPDLLAVGSRVAGFEAVDVDACTAAGCSSSTRAASATSR